MTGIRHWPGTGEIQGPENERTAGEGGREALWVDHPIFS